MGTVLHNCNDIEDHNYNIDDNNADDDKYDDDDDNDDDNDKKEEECFEYMLVISDKTWTSTCLVF